MTLLDVKKVVDTIVNSNTTKTISNLVQYVLITVISILLLYPQTVYENFTKYQEKKHSELVEKRLEIGPEIQTIMNEVSLDLNADRVFLCEFHNGTNNFAGLPFLYLDMKYELVAVGVDNVDDEYVNFNLTKYQFVPYGLQLGYWAGCTEDMEIIDKRFAANMERDCVCYIAGSVVTSPNNDLIGVVGIAYGDSVKCDDPEKMENVLKTAANKLGGMLIAE